MKTGAIYYSDCQLDPKIMSACQRQILKGIKEENIVRQHGAVIQTPFLSAKRFKIKGIIHNTTQALSSSELDDLQQNLLADKNFFRDRADREIEAFAKKVRVKPEIGSDKAILKCRGRYGSTCSVLYYCWGFGRDRIYACRWC